MNVDFGIFINIGNKYNVSGYKLWSFNRYGSDRVHNNNITHTRGTRHIQVIFSVKLFFRSNVRQFIAQKNVSVCNIWIGLILRMENPESGEAQEWNHCKYYIWKYSRKNVNGEREKCTHSMVNRVQAINLCTESKTIPALHAV